MTPTERKANERAHIAAKNVYVKDWIPSHELPQFAAMKQRAFDALKKETE